MNSLSQSPQHSAVSIDVFRRFSADQAQQNKVIIRVSNGEIIAADQESLETSMDGQRVGGHLSSTAGSSGDIVRAFTGLLNAKYGEKIASWVFPDNKRKEASTTGLDQAIVKNVFHKIDTFSVAKNNSRESRYQALIQESDPTEASRQKSFVQPPFSREEADEIIEAQNKKNIFSEEKLSEPSSSKKVELNDDTEIFSGVPNEEGGWRDVGLTDEEYLKIHHDWAFLKLDIAEAQKEAKKQSSRPSFLATNVNEKLRGLEQQKATLETKYPFLKESQEQRKATIRFNEENFS